jgi:G:T-mismatch repair DNA endonuclease (very short patch repair protein)
MAENAGRTAKTRQLLKMAENGWKCWNVAYDFKKIIKLAIIGKRVRVTWGCDKEKRQLLKMAENAENGWKCWKVAYYLNNLNLKNL